MKTKLILLLSLLSQLLFAQTPIATVRTQRAGKTVTITGNITAAFGRLSFIQDNTGGIAVYDADVSLNDSISITGKISRYNGMLEVVGDSVTIISRNHQTQPLPLLIGNIADHEGELVQVNNISLTPTHTFFYPLRAGFIKQENDSIQYWIDDNTDIPGYSIPISANIIGVVGRYNNTLQILPRSHSDIFEAVIEPPTPSNYFTIMNWNVEFFGAKKYGPTNDELQISNVYSVINKVQPDILALQEVSSDVAFETLISKLPNYTGRCSNHYSYSYLNDTASDFPPQKLCFVYKTTVKATNEKILFRKVFDEHPSDMFASGRLPYLLEFNINGQKISLVNLHAKSGSSESDFNRRQSDATLLKDTLDNYTNIILLGDFNQSPNSIFVNDNNYSCISQSFTNMIDHQIISSSLTPKQISTKVLNVYALINQYHNTTSDHVPVISEFDFNNIITSVKDQAQLLAYPNPTGGQLWFPDHSNITVINTLGEIIIKEEGAHPPISLGNHAPGLYLVVLEDQIFRIIKI